MPRQPRYDLPGMPQHVIQRGNNRQAVFFSEADCHRYLNTLDAVACELRCLIHAWVLMTNHVHLLVTPLEAKGLSRLMQSLGRRYVAYINRTYSRSGTLWEGRYKASLISADDYLLACMRYLELNPVRAGMVAHPSEYVWSSYGFNAFGRDGPLSTTPHGIYLNLGRDVSERQERYRALFSNALGPAQLHDIREATNSCVVLGTKEFAQRISAATGQRTQKRKAGRPRKKEIAV